MKVRHRYNKNYTNEVVSQFTRAGKEWIVLASDVQNGLYFIVGLMDDYEVIPEETWRDVTGECGLELEYEKGPSHFQHHPNTPRCNTLFSIPYLFTLEGYRLRKVKVKVYDPVQTGNWSPEIDWIVGTAFIIEKREP